MTFASSRDAIKYIAQSSVIEDAIVEVFKSPWSNDPVNFTEVLRHIMVMEQLDLGLIIFKRFREFQDVDLNLYKFKILMGYRGPLTENHIEEFVENTVKKEPNRIGYIEVAKHKDFPYLGKEFMTEFHNDLTFLVLKEAQELFIF